MKIKTYFQGRTTNFYVIWIFIIAVVVRIPFLFMTLNEAYGDRQVQNAFPALFWREDGFDPLVPKVPVFGRGGLEGLLEFPVFQWTIFWIYHVVPSLDAAARLAGLIFFQLSALALYGLVSSVSSNQAALASLGLYQFNAYSMKWSSTATVDLAVIATFLTGLFLIRKATSSEKIRAPLFSASVAFLVLSCLMKPWVVVIWFPVLILLLSSTGPNLSAISGRNSWASLSKGFFAALLLVVVVLGPAWLWTEWAARQRRGWQEGIFFITGNLADRTLINLLKVLQFEFGFVIGGIFVAALLVYFWFRKLTRQTVRNSAIFILASLVLVLLVPVFLFTAKFAGHNYYAILITPAVAMFTVLILNDIIRRAHQVMSSTALMVGTAFVTVLGYLNYLIVEGIQLMFSTQENRQAYGGLLPAIAALLASISCFVLLAAFWSSAKLNQGNRFTTTRLRSRRFMKIFAILLALYILFVPVRLFVDVPRFSPLLSEAVHRVEPRSTGLVLGCDSTTVHYYLRSEGLSLLGISQSSSKIDRHLPTHDLDEFDFIVSCRPDITIDAIREISAATGSFVGGSFGGLYQVKVPSDLNFISVFDGLWVRQDG